MNWVIFGVLLGLVIFNLLGVGIYHYEYKKDHKNNPKHWKSDKGFWTWTIYLIFLGTAYCVIRLIVWIKDIIVENSEQK